MLGAFEAFRRVRNPLVGLKGTRVRGGWGLGGWGVGGLGGWGVGGLGGWGVGGLGGWGVGGWGVGGCPFSPTFFLGKGSPTKIDHRKKGSLVLASLLEDLAKRKTPLLECPPKKRKSFGPSRGLFLRAESMSRC